MVCPECRSDLVRRRKRGSLPLLVRSWFGKWPYRCGQCGFEFTLRERSPRQTKRLEEREEERLAAERARLRLEAEAAAATGQHPAGQHPVAHHPVAQYPAGQHPAGQHRAGQQPGD